MSWVPTYLIEGGRIDLLHACGVAGELWSRYRRGGSASFQHTVSNKLFGTVFPPIPGGRGLAGLMVKQESDIVGLARWLPSLPNGAARIPAPDQPPRAQTNLIQLWTSDEKA